MIDFMQFIDASSAIKGDWGAEHVKRCLKIISTIEGVEFDWDQHAGETWSAHRSDLCWAYVNARIPLIIGNSTAMGLLDRIYQIRPVVYVLDNEVDQKKYCLDRKEFEAFCKCPISDALDFNSLSFRDIWWLNV